MNDLTTIGRWIIFGGVGLLIIGALILAAGRLNIPLGRLPGDIRIERQGFSCFVPFATSLIFSLLLTIILNLILRGMR